MIISAGAKKVLKLGTANCFSSFYTHYIPTIILGYEKAEDNYKKKLKGEQVEQIYRKYSQLDEIIRKQN